MSFYYTREDGRILIEQGMAPGESLLDLIAHGALPTRAALELLAGLADILTVAEEDNATHGDISPGSVQLTHTGSIGISGYGKPRRSGSAPEEEPVGVMTDTYGIGVVLCAALTGAPLGQLPRDQDEHDDAIRRRLQAVDWSEIADRPWFDNVLGFVHSLFAYNPGDRPRPPDVSNICYEIVPHIDGDSLAQWARVSIQAALSEPVTRERDSGGASTGPIPEPAHRPGDQPPSPDTTQMRLQHRTASQTPASTDTRRRSALVLPGVMAVAAVLAGGRVALDWTAPPAWLNGDTESIQLWQACQGGAHTACTTLGEMSADGAGVTKDEAQAAQLYEQACSGGHMPACHRLGDLYKSGSGVPQDDVRAAQLYARVCRRGNESLSICEPR